MDKEQIYKQGFLDGLEAYAFKFDGVFYVGGEWRRELKAAKERVEKTWNYNPEKVESLDQDELDEA